MALGANDYYPEPGITTKFIKKKNKKKLNKIRWNEIIIIPLLKQKRKNNENTSKRDY